MPARWSRAPHGPVAAPSSLRYFHLSDASSKKDRGEASSCRATTRTSARQGEAPAPGESCSTGIHRGRPPGGRPDRKPDTSHSRGCGLRHRLCADRGRPRPPDGVSHHRRAGGATARSAHSRLVVGARHDHPLPSLPAAAVSLMSASRPLPICRPRREAVLC